MKLLSLKLREDVFDAVERVIHEIHIPRNAYINEALRFYSRLYQRKLMRKQLTKESKLVGDRSVEVLREFEKLEDQLP